MRLKFAAITMHPVTKGTIVLLFSLAMCYTFDYGIHTFLLSSILPLLAFMYFGQDQEDKLPPGPLGLPIVGCLPWLMRDSNKYFMECHKKYGAMFTLRLGNSANVIINDYEMIKEFGNLAQGQHRPNVGIIRELVKTKGLVDAEGEVWMHQRRFVLHSLRDSGMGKLQMDDKIMNEMGKMIKYIESQGGKPMCFRRILSLVTSSIVCKLSFDKQFDYEDPKFLALIAMFNEQIVVTGKLYVLTFFPWLRLFFKTKFLQAETNMKRTHVQCAKIVDEHRKSLDPNNPRDLIDLYLLEMEREPSEETKPYLDTFTEEQLIFITMDLFFAGTETTSTTIMWALAYMAMYPEIQRKVQAEIDDVLGEEGTPSTTDRYRLPYAMATLQEVERFATIAPRALPRSNKVQLSFRGYSFPSGTIFSFNIHAVHRDPRLWKNPDVFNPDRFMQADGTVFRPPHLMPFGSGRRACVGEALARTEIFIMFSSLMQKFSFKIPQHIPLEIKSTIGIVNSIHDYKLEAVPRHPK